jgi:hypothetical protein
MKRMARNLTAVDDGFLTGNRYLLRAGRYFRSNCSNASRASAQDGAAARSTMVHRVLGNPWRGLED